MLGDLKKFQSFCAERVAANLYTPSTTLASFSVSQSRYSFSLAATLSLITDTMDENLGIMCAIRNYNYFQLQKLTCLQFIHVFHICQSMRVMSNKHW